VPAPVPAAHVPDPDGLSSYSSPEFAVSDSGPG
jgi:hypothetical protein